MGFVAAGSGALTALYSLLFFISASFIFSIIFWIVAKRMIPSMRMAAPSSGASMKMAPKPSRKRRKK